MRESLQTSICKENRDWIEKNFKMLALILLCLLYYTISVTEATASPLVVLITGCSTGIGRATALKFAANPKYKVYATMRNTEKWKSLSSPDEPEELLKVPVVEEMDVTNEVEVQRVVDGIVAKEGKIDIVVNNAGYGLAGCLETVTVNEAKV